MTAITRGLAGLVFLAALGAGLATSACSPFARPCRCPAPAAFVAGRYAVTDSTEPRFADATVEVTATELRLTYAGAEGPREIVLALPPP